MASGGGKREISAPRYSDGAAHYDMGEHTLRIPMSLHAHNRERLVARLRELVAEGRAPQNSVIILQGNDDHPIDSTENCHLFRQESYFHWLFGVLEPGWYGAIDVATGRTTLFCPRLPESYAVIMGRIIPTEDFRTRYQVQGVHYVDEIADVLRQMSPGALLTMRGQNSDSGLTTAEAVFDGISRFTVNNTVLHDEMAELRVTKTPEEIEVMRYVTEISSAAHGAVMRHIRPGMREYQLEAVFQHHTYYHGGCRHQAYTNICGAGVSSAVLHYGHAGAPNDCVVRDGDICLFDMGAEYYGYASDITCSFPANGKFTADQKMIYNAVLAANRAVHAAARPGASWVDMHALSNRVMLEALRDGGLLQGNVDEMMEANLGAVFQPHGLGHLIGLNVHDVGGYLSHCPERPAIDGQSRLRTARLLQENMLLTIEPGCYFIDCVLDSALADPRQSRFFVREVLERFRGFGGIRIEDDVLITANGVEDLTRVPRTVEEIEALMAEGRREEVTFPQQQGKHPSQQ